MPEPLHKYVAALGGRSRGGFQEEVRPLTGGGITSRSVQNPSVLGVLFRVLVTADLEIGAAGEFYFGIFTF